MRETKTRRRRVAKRSPYVGPDNPNDKGDWVEMVFMARAAALGLIVSRPYGSKSFDFVVCPRRGPLSRVQVKSVWSMRDRMYRVRTCGTHGRRYRRGEVDFIVAYVVPEDAWYVIPLAEISYRMAYLSPHIPGSRARWEKFREAWGLLRGEEPGYGIELKACAEGSSQSPVAGRQEEPGAGQTELVRLAAARSGCYFLEQTLGM